MLHFKTLHDQVRGYQAAAVGLSMVVGGAFAVGAEQHTATAAPAPHPARVKPAVKPAPHHARRAHHPRPSAPSPHRPHRRSPSPAPRPATSTGGTTSSGAGVSSGTPGPTQSSSHSS